MTKKTIMQLLREFWIQTFLSLIWAIYKLQFIQQGDNKLSLFISNFMASLFLLSWLFGQFIRVKKQQKIEEEFENVRNTLQGLLTKIEKQTKDLIGFSTGGNSIAYFQPSIPAGTLTLCFDLINTSAYPVFDFSGEWIDLDEPINPEKGKFWTRNNFLFGDIYPSKIAMGLMKFDFTNRTQLRINIFAMTRNRNVTQQFRVVKVDNRLHIAFQTTSNDFKENRVPSDFPGYDADDIEKVFK